jgi:hypothetical protein
MNASTNNLTSCVVATASLLLLISTAQPALAQEMGFFSRKNIAEEFIMSIPSDCDYISESNVLGSPKFFIFHTCHRGGGAWLHEVPKATRVAPGILYVPNQSLSNGEVAEGFYCSNKAKRHANSRTMKCTRHGWRESQPYQ